MKIEKGFRLRKQDCIKLKEDLESMYDIDLSKKSRKSEFIAIRAAFFSAVRNEFVPNNRPSFPDLAGSLGFDHSTCVYHVGVHEANYTDIKIPFNQSYRSWYKRFASHIRENYTTK